MYNMYMYLIIILAFSVRNYWEATVFENILRINFIKINEERIEVE